MVFDCVTLLEAAYIASNEHLDTKHKKRTDDSTLRDYGYDAEFVLETLMTYKLLFPLRDIAWLRGLIKKGAGRSPNNGNYPTDKRLTSPASMDVPSSHQYYGRPIKNSQELFRRYPHWAVRLQVVFEEADDPTPTSQAGMWAERHKASRHSFWITFVAFAVAIAFGIISTCLGVVQIWISYCAWRSAESGVCWTPS